MLQNFKFEYFNSTLSVKYMWGQVPIVIVILVATFSCLKNIKFFALAVSKKVIP